MNKDRARHHLREYIATGGFRGIQEEDWDELQEHRNFRLCSTEEALYDLAEVCMKCGKPREACDCSIIFEKALQAMRACHKVYLQDSLPKPKWNTDKE